MSRVSPDERRWRNDALLETTTDFAVITLTLDNVIETWNRGAERIFEFTAAEAIGQSGTLIFTPDDIINGVAERELGHARTSGRAEDVRWHRRKSGSLVWATGVMILLPDQTGAPYRMAKIVIDATEQKMAEDALQDSEARLRLVAGSVPQLIWTARPDGAIDYVNDRWIDYAASPDELLGWAWQELVHPEDRPRTLERWLNAVRTGRPYEAEYRLRQPDGAHHWVLSKARAQRDERGVTGWFGSSTDITAFKQSEEAVRETQRFESIGVLAGGVAHDFNNLLTAVLGNAALALRALPSGDASLRPLLEDIVAAGERAASLTAQLLAYAGRGRVAAEHVDLCELLAESRELIAAAIPKEAEVVYDGPGACFVAGDRGQLQQLAIALIINGAEALRGPGTVEVGVRSADLDAEALARWAGAPPRGAELRAGKYITLEVRDTGVGMDAATQGRVFDPFFTTKFPGRGLGLAAALGIARAHGGAIAVESEPGVGTRLTVLLPAADPAAADRPAQAPGASVPGPPRAPAATRTGTVLVVDDEEPVRVVARRMLGELGYEVLEAGNGREALDRHGGALDALALVLLDLTMPQMNGEETLRRLRLLAPALPVVLMSGYGDVEALRRVPEIGPEAFLAKPFTLEALGRALDAAASARS